MGIQGCTPLRKKCIMGNQDVKRGIGGVPRKNGGCK